MTREFHALWAPILLGVRHLLPPLAFALAVTPALAACALGDDAAAGSWPALAPDYSCAAAPQGEAEEALAADHPELWGQGVRAVSAVTFVRGALPTDPTVPAVLAQCLDGAVYRGTDVLPLGFRGVPEDAEALPEDVVEAVLAGEIGEAGTGRGGYSVTITENYGLLRGRDGITEDDDTTLVISWIDDASELEVGGAEPRRFPDPDAAWAWVEAHGFVPHADGSRALHSGEIAKVTMLRETGARDGDENVWDEYVYRPRTQAWVAVDGG